MDDVAALERDRNRPGRTSTAEWLADILRDRITEGFFTPGQRLSEEAIGAALDVSRNTLREAFRLLSHERLLEHRLNRGVFVRVLSVKDVADLYRVRRVIEGAAVRHPWPTRAGEEADGEQGGRDRFAAMREAVEAAGRAAAEDRWNEVGTANIRFHQALVTLNGSARLDELMRQLLAELRLIFHVMRNPRSFHEPFVARNRKLLKLMEDGEYEKAELELASYFDDAEALLVEAYQPEG